MPVVRSGAAEQRTANGCWTCRLRKLKCDEGIDKCNECSRHGIPCAGYGKEKPEWKDGGVKEAEKLESIKNFISLKRKRDRQRPHNTNSEPRKFSIIKASKTTESPESSSPTQQRRSEKDLGLARFAHDAQFEASDFAPLQLSPPFWDIVTPEASGESALQSSTREDELVMHYLDFVFTLQFRHHKYAATFSSRSWLFSLVKRITPLRHSVLSLSALHQYRLHQHGILGMSLDNTLQELQDHHAATLSELRQFIRDPKNDSLTDNHIPILACCVQLISFDVWSVYYYHNISDS
jgi:hypothetical protein